jgi:hypothetical protein
MNNANEELVRATNDYLSAVGGGDELKAPSRSHATPVSDRARVYCELMHAHTHRRATHPAPI